MALELASRFLWIAVACISLLHGSYADARERASEGAARVTSTDALPIDARETLARIRAGGPFPFQRDGVVFNNYERLLPAQPRGYYREYTVAPPSSVYRGARRIVVGCDRESGSRDDPDTLPGCRGPAELYYTDDHYRSFRRIVQ